jgi:hypothetical protein
VFNYNYKKKTTLEELMDKERPTWTKTRDRILKGEKEEDSGEEEDDEDFDEEEDMDR